jgi:hypothetical protein
VKGTKSKEEGNDPKSFIAFLLLCAQVSQLSFFSSLPHFVSSIALREGKLITFAQCMETPHECLLFGLAQPGHWLGPVTGPGRAGWVQPSSHMG